LETFPLGKLAGFSRKRLVDKSGMQELHAKFLRLSRWTDTRAIRITTRPNIHIETEAAHFLMRPVTNQQL
jgi:hypothetical protein